MKEVVHIIALSQEEYEWLRELVQRKAISSEFHDMMADYMCENIEQALKAQKIGYINEKYEITLTVRIF